MAVRELLTSGSTRVPEAMGPDHVGMSVNELAARLGSPDGFSRTDVDAVARSLVGLGDGSSAVVVGRHGDGSLHAVTVANVGGRLVVIDPSARPGLRVTGLAEGLAHFSEMGASFHDGRVSVGGGDPRVSRPDSVGDARGGRVFGGHELVGTRRDEGESTRDGDGHGSRVEAADGETGGSRRGQVGEAQMPNEYPRPQHEGEVTVSGRDVPGSRTAFASRTDLEPNTLYHVEGRGDFYTDAAGRVVFVEATYGHGDKGRLNPDLHYPQADVTYVVHPDITHPIEGVSHAHVFQTDHKGRVVFAHTDALGLGEADRSESVQQRVGREGGPGFDGGHTYANFVGGGAERINIDPMIAALNRGSGDSFYNLEGLWRMHLKTDPPPVIPVTIHKVFSGAGGVPTSFEVGWRVGGGDWERTTFTNGL